MRTPPSRSNPETAPAAGPKEGSRRGTAPSEAYGNIRAFIVDGRLAPGVPLIETDLSLRLGISRTPVRAALQRLQREGFVVGRRVGNMMRMVVAPLTVEDMAELFEMVGALEGVASRRAARRPEPERLEVVTRLRQINCQLGAVDGEDPQSAMRAQDLHESLHETLLMAGAGSRLLAELESLRPQVARYGHAFAGASLRDLEQSVHEHEAIIDALEAGDPAIERLTVLNWRKGAERYRRIVEVQGERGQW